MNTCCPSCDQEAELIDLLEEEAAAQSRERFLTFVQTTYCGKAERYDVNWHHELLAGELQHFVSDECPDRFLMVFMPPRHGKSELVSRNLPAWYLGRNPNREVMGASYSADLAEDMSSDVQRIMTGPAYKRIFPGVRILEGSGSRYSEDKRSRGAFSIIGHSGQYRCAGVGGAITGRGADLFIIDDPIKNRADAESETHREKTWKWYTSTVRTRLSKRGKIILLLTRWHEDDLAGRLIRQMRQEPQADQWRVFSLPAQYEASEHSHPQDKRGAGDALWKTEFDLENLLQVKATLGSYEYGALYQQRPLPPGGAVIQREWLLQHIIAKAPTHLAWVRYWDLACTSNKKGNRTAGVQVAMDAGNLFIRNMIKGRWNWPTARKIMRTAGLREKCPIGADSTGPQKALIQNLQEERDLIGISITGYPATTDKLTNALSWIAMAEAGRVYIVDGDWVDDFIAECVRFTGHDDREDDQVDAVSGGVRMLMGGGGLETLD